MKKKTGVPDHMIIVVRDTINDPYTTLPPQGVQSAQSFFDPSIFRHPSSYYPCPTGLNFKEQKGNPDLALVQVILLNVPDIVDWFFQIILLVTLYIT